MSEQRQPQNADIELAALSLCGARHGYSPSAPCADCHAAIVRLVDAPSVGEAVAWAIEFRPLNQGEWTLLTDTVRGTIGEVEAEIIQRNAAHPDDGRRVIPLYATPPAAPGPVVTAEDCLVPLARLGAWVLAEVREHGSDIDGGDVQDKAETFGVIAPEPAQKPCCENCACAEYDSDICYRNTKATNDALTALQGEK